MSEHSGTVFTNSCVKTPVNPLNRFPSPSFERKRYNKTPNCVFSDTCDGFTSFADFYKSIPEYYELNHLSNAEFYSKLEDLKLKRREYSAVRSTPPPLTSFDRDEDFVVPHEIKPQKQLNKNVNSKKVHAQNYETYRRVQKSEEYVCKDLYPKSPKRSVRIQQQAESNPKYPKREEGIHTKRESEKEKLRSKRETDIGDYFDEIDLKRDANILDDVDDPAMLKSRSMPCSPIRKRTTSPKVTIPKPFRMTQRDEDDKTLGDLYRSSECLVSDEKRKEKNKTIKAHPVPLESRVPLYDVIMADQEKRRQINKINSAIELNAQMKPFHFNERLKPPSRCLSTPHLSSDFGNELKSKHFKAKPVPKNMYSNYFYQKMWEDDYYRSLKRRIRAEEMLKASSLPPSMAKREKFFKNSSSSCSKHYCQSDFECREYSTPSTGSSGTGKPKKKKRKNKKKTNFYCSNDKLKRERDFQNAKSEFLATSPDLFSFETDKRDHKKPASPYTSKLFKMKLPKSPAPIYPVSRPNLAAALRVEWVKHKLQGGAKETDGAQDPPHRGWSAHAVKSSPAFQALHYPSHSADLAERLETRKAEQRMRQAEHDLNMELMIDRVLKTPLLLERNYPQNPSKKHNCQHDNIHEIHEQDNTAMSKHGCHRKQNKGKKKITSKHSSQHDVYDDGRAGTPQDFDKDDEIDEDFTYNYSEDYDKNYES